MINPKQSAIQEEIIDKTLKFYQTNDKGYLDLTMRSGKTKITLEFIKRSMESSMILLCYPDNKLKITWKEEMEKWHFKGHIIDFVNFSSLHNYINNYYNLIICDEFHALSEGESESLSKIIKNADKTIFLSGTISKETKQKWPRFKEIAKYTTIQAIEDKVVADYSITVHLVDLDTTILTPNKKGKMKSENQRYEDYSYVMKQFKENGKDFMHLALARNRISISSIAKKNYLLKLLDKYKDKRCIVFCGLSEVADNLGIPSHHSKSPNDNNLQAFQRKEFNHLALVEQGGIGVTYKDLDCVILLNFVGNSASTSQKLNRGIMLDYMEKCSNFDIICLRKAAEQAKLKESLSMLDAKRIKYV